MNQAVDGGRARLPRSPRTIAAAIMLGAALAGAEPPEQFDLDMDAIAPALASAPRQHDALPPPGDRVTIELPHPNGQSRRYTVYETALLPSSLQARFPEIRAYAGQGIDDPSASLRLDVSPGGLRAMILTADGAVFIDPVGPGNPAHTVAFKADLAAPPRPWTCNVEGGLRAIRLAPDPNNAPEGPVVTRVYRIAMAATGEFTLFHGGTKSAGLAAVVTVLNRVTGVTERDLGVSLQLAANNDQLIYTNPLTDPYTNTSPVTMIGQNQLNCDTLIGPANYELGHVLATAGGGYGEIGSVCQNGKKAMGATGFFPPVGDPFAIDYVAHELGHQLGGNHCFNGVGQSCKNGRWAATAFEPGSGSTIMSYAGICGPTDDLQPHSDPYFHAGSIAEITSYLKWAGLCGWTTSNGNNAPVITAMPPPSLTVPRATPFELKAQGFDPDGDAIVWSWEQMDLGPAIPAAGTGSGDNAASPIFRSWAPAFSAARTFPAPGTVLWNTPIIGELWHQTTRTLKFRVTARDNRAGGGGVATADTQLNVYAGMNPFAVIQPASGAWAEGGVLVQWNPSGTTGWPIFTSHIHIRLSTDGGATYPYTLAEWVNNADTQRWVSLPAVSSSQARIRVEAAGNVYFAVSGQFTVSGSGPGPCVADCDKSGSLNIDDVICFITNYAGKFPSADCDANSIFDVDDFICFQANFAIGC